MAKTVSNLTGLQIDHYLYVDLNGFQDVVNTLGGVELCIPAYNVNTPGWVEGSRCGRESRRRSTTTRSVTSSTRIPASTSCPGCQKLDGSQGLAYVRARHLPCDAIPDFARIGRQQQFMRAVINQMLKPAQIAKAPGSRRAGAGQPASRPGLPSGRPGLSGRPDARAQHRGCRIPGGAWDVQRDGGRPLGASRWTQARSRSSARSAMASPSRASARNWSTPRRRRRIRPSP